MLPHPDGVMSVIERGRREGGGGGAALWNHPTEETVTFQALMGETETT